MPYYRQLGDVPAKRHTQFRRSDGALYAEELVGQLGFSGESSLLYHREPPTSLRAVTPIACEPDQGSPNHPVQPWLLQGDLIEWRDDVLTGRTPLLVNGDVRIGMVRPQVTSPLYRNSDGDEIVFLIDGSARLETSFGPIDASGGDYVVIPKGVVHRWTIDAGTGPLMLTIETSGHVGPPDRYLSSHGQFLEGAPFSERDIHGPEELAGDRADGPVDIIVRRDGQLTCHHHTRHPFDVVGWDGCLYPYRFSIHDFEPITGRIHQPPPVHQTFAGPGFVICSFVPRLFDTDPLAVPAPYYHANTDSDEVIVYVDGDFMSRKGVPIRPASMSLHPAGFVHGPQPGSVEASLGAERTEETAVMVDTFAPLRVTDAARGISDGNYLSSWKGGAR